MDTKPGYASSFIWRSIWTTEKLLNEGLVWRVGSGKKISIWSMRLPLQPSYGIKSPMKILEEHAKVRELEMEETNCWNERLINEILTWMKR